ncbi:beta-propeller fold lactonase family protein [bacterium]|nr:beta-propeller fold lactonase family protein [bacterium]
MRHSLILALALALSAPALAIDGFVGCSTSDDCWPFDLQTHQVRPSIPLMGFGDYPYDATVTPDGMHVWFIGASGGGAVVISRTSGALVAIVPLAEYVVSVAFDRDGTRAFVSSRDETSLNIVDTASYGVVDTLPLPVDGGNLALEPVGGKLYLVDWYGPILCEVAGDGSAVLRQAALGSSLWQIVAAPDGQHVYVTDRGTDEVLEVALDTFTVSRRFDVGDDPWGLDVTADGTTLVVTCEDSAEVVLIDLATGAVTPIALDPSADPRDVDILDEAGLAYVAGGTATGYQSPVYVVDLPSATVVETLDGPGINANVVAVQAQMHEAPTAAETPDAPASLAVHPNPFNPRATVTWQIAAPAAGTIAVHDLAGRRVRTLVQGVLPAGTRTATWDGRDASGRALPSGTYLVSLRTGAATMVRKVVLAR